MATRPKRRIVEVPEPDAGTAALHAVLKEVHHLREGRRDRLPSFQRRFGNETETYWSLTTDASTRRTFSPRLARIHPVANRPDADVIL
ncbi:PREDICTED: uncharacterized protein LOC105555989 isoform X2 [Vollenhovia emeryi]|uniref:uncharacterized protein LOC105555989 isoform X2 n=1 Tax=Vollenhovia emeryi TaxID=411798 RepID=UPI0005F370E5|nr:PREDICTED: uncharacterized protein LOC105555989 isoform X2 [Vollenhovia emeryi]